MLEGRGSCRCRSLISSSDDIQTDPRWLFNSGQLDGTDLHILKGDLPSVTPGRILGHEGIGVVMEVGTAVRAVRPGMSRSSGIATSR